MIATIHAHPLAEYMRVVFPDGLIARPIYCHPFTGWETVRLPR